MDDRIERAPLAPKLIPSRSAHQHTAWNRRLQSSLRSLVADKSERLVDRERGDIQGRSCAGAIVFEAVAEPTVIRRVLLARPRPRSFRRAAPGHPREPAAARWLRPLVARMRARDF
jgi:hypothetical protein